jgi:hypothetical protein
MNKKTKYLVLTTVALVLSFLLTACGSSAKSSAAAQTAVAGTKLPTAARLVAGTFRLLESDTPLTASQAGELSTLWKAYLELESRDSKASQEETDLLAQIESTYSTEQLAAIDSLGLTMQDVMALAQQEGVATVGNPSGDASSRPVLSGSGSGGGPGAMGFSGAPPADMGGAGFPGGDFPTDAAMASGEFPVGNADSSGAGFADIASTIANQLVEPLITKLETLAGTGN